ncbi:MAG: DMT family transporter [Clostridia bacterium]|nr:DMT family transporter [Clostridia bacterium]
MQKSKALILSLFVMLLWGTLFPTVKLSYSAFDISTTGDILFFAGMRFVVCGGVICLFSLITDKASFKPAKSSILPILLAGLFSIILHYACTYSALQLTDSSKTAILKQVGVLFYVCFSSLFFKDDKLSVKKLIGALLGFAGIIVINLNVDGVSFNIGDLLIIIASFCSVFSSIISKKVFVTVKPITATGISQLFGGIVLAIIGRAMGGSMTVTASLSSLLFVYICIASVVSYCIWFTVVKSGELSRLFIIKFAEPAFACIFGAMLLNENIFQWQYILSFLFIAGGIYISNK